MSFLVTTTAMKCKTCGESGPWDIDHTIMNDGRITDYLRCENCDHIQPVIVADYNSTDFPVYDETFIVDE